MGRIFNAVVDYLSEDDWMSTVLEGESTLMLSFRGRSGSWQCFGRADEEKECFCFYSVLPSHAAEEKRATVAEYINRANYGLIIGNFEMDYRDGQVRYKTSLDVEDSAATRELVRHIVYANVTAMDRYLPGILAVIAGSKSPADAVAEIDDTKEPDLSKS